MSESKRRIPWLALLPLIVFVALAGLFLVRLYSGDPARLPSALIGKQAPKFALPAIEGRRPQRFLGRRPDAGPGNARQRLRVVVRALPRGAPDPDADRRRTRS